MKILHLTLKKKWFDMTDSGEKTEEYREIKPYWISRLIDCNLPEESPGENNVVIAINGYGARPTWHRKCVDITIGEGREEWGADPDKLYFVIKLGDRI